MAILALPPPAAIVWPFSDKVLSTEWEGDKGAVLWNAIQIKRHWSKLSCDAPVPSPKANDAFDYNPLPLEVSFKTRVRYKFVGDLKPLPYVFDE
jgi:hypothetical protein